MSFKELQGKVHNFDSGERLHKITEGFTRFFASLFVLVGTLLTAFGVATTQVYQPEQAAKIDMWVLSDMWHKIFALFEAVNVPIWAVALIIMFVSAVIAALVTVVFFFIARALCGKKKPTEIEETAENARTLLQRFEDHEPTWSDKQEVMRKRMQRFFFFFFVFFLSMSLMHQQADPERIYLMGFLYAILCLIVFYIFRAVFIVSVQVCWKKNKALENQITNELKTTVKYLERKEKETADKQKAEQLAKEKEENLKRAEAMYKAFEEAQSKDMHQLYQIAKLGHHDATLAYIEWSLPKTVSPELTRDEQKRFLQRIHDALVMVGKYDQHSNITKFFYYSTLMGLGKIRDKKTAQNALDELRFIKSSGDLSEEHTEVCTDLIEALVKFINKLY